jgi:hypothetical protein
VGFWEMSRAEVGITVSIMTFTYRCIIASIPVVDFSMRWNQKLNLPCLRGRHVLSSIVGADIPRVNRLFSCSTVTQFLRRTPRMEAFQEQSYLQGNILRSH